MKSSNGSIKGLFWAGWGATTLFLQLPLVNMMLDDPESLLLGTWDWRGFSFFSLLTFVLIPALAGAILAGVARASRRAAWILLALGCGYLLSMQINFHVLQFHFMEAGWRKYALAALFALVSGAVYRFRDQVLRLLPACAALSPLVFGFFLLQGSPASVAGQTAPEPRPAASPEHPPVFFLTFEKIVADYLLDDQGRVLDRFPNLAAFASGADFYPQTYSNCTATVYSLKTLYSGRVTTSQRDWTRRPNIRDILGRDRKVVMQMDLLTSYCNPLKNVCIRTIGEGGRRGIDIAAGWYKTWLLTVMPDPLEARLTLLGWHFNPWFDLWAGEEASLKPGEKVCQKVGTRQLERLTEAVRWQGSTPTLYIMHNFISDNPGVKASALTGRHEEERADELEGARENLAVFDRELGKFLQFLKEQGLYDRSLIVITADTGYDFDSRRVRGQEELPFSRDMTRVFFAMKRPGQPKGRVLPSTFRQVDVLPTLLAGLGIDPRPYAFEGVPVTDPEDRGTLAERPLDFMLTSEQAGVLHYRVNSPTGSLRRVR